MGKQGEKDAIFATSELVLNIKSRMQQMNPAQKKIAKFILENLDEVQECLSGDGQKKPGQ